MHGHQECPGDAQLLGHSRPRLNDFCQHTAAVEPSLAAHSPAQLCLLLVVLFSIITSAILSMTVLLAT